jgi:hypothetical protein
VDYKEEVAIKLVERVLQKQAEEKRFLASRTTDPMELITIPTSSELEAYVRRINDETFRVPLGKIQIGRARYTRLAQVNLRTRTMTVSQYCLNQVPASGLRYLIVHELAHFLEAGHTKRFWGLVGQFVPDYREQSRLIKAYHRMAVQAEQAQDETTPSPKRTTAKSRLKQAAVPSAEPPSGLLQTFLFDLKQWLTP